MSMKTSLQRCSTSSPEQAVTKLGLGKKRTLTINSFCFLRTLCQLYLPGVQLLPQLVTMTTEQKTTGINSSSLNIHIPTDINSNRSILISPSTPVDLYSLSQDLVRFNENSRLLIISSSLDGCQVSQNESAESPERHNIMFYCDKNQKIFRLYLNKTT